MDLDLATRSPGGSDDIDGASTGQGLGIVPGLVWAFRIHEDGSAEALALDQPIQHRRDGWLWLHFNLADVRSCHWLTAADMPAPAVAMLMSRDRHQQLHMGDNCIYGIFADHVRRIDGSSDEIGHLRFYMTERLLVSGRHHPLTSVESARKAIERGGRRLPHVAALLELIVDHVADAIDQMADELAIELDQIEDGLAAQARCDEPAKLSHVRRACVRLHRQLSGLRAVFHRLEREGTENLKPSLRVAASKLAQRLDALDHIIIEIRDRARLLQEEVSAVLAEESNRHLHILAILTALFLPPTLVTGVFGMNIKGLPFTDVESGFIWAIVLMIASSVAVYLLLRRAGIFKK